MKRLTVTVWLILMTAGIIIILSPAVSHAEEHTDCTETCPGIANAACREAIEWEHDYVEGCTNYGIADDCHGCPYIIAEGGSYCRLTTTGATPRPLATQTCTVGSDGKLGCKAQGTIQCFATTGSNANKWVSNGYTSWCWTNSKGYPPEQKVQKDRVECNHASDLRAVVTECNTSGGLSSVYWP